MAAELKTIASLPNGGCALRGDKVAKLYAREMGICARKSVDVCADSTSGILLIECKYRAQPETQIVKDVRSFRENVLQKFEETVSFLAEQTTRRIYGRFVVLFNAESLQKVNSMFMRLKLEDDDRRLFANFDILDTKSFCISYGDWMKK